nr:T9SS type A sorting domain-containing protein [Bacteroidota bacterium]
MSTIRLIRGSDNAGWSDGLYIVHLQTEKEVLSKKFVKE